MVKRMTSTEEKKPAGRISLIAAMAQNRVIGRDGGIPWHVAGEQKLFKRITLGHTLIMGRKTHESIGRPLAERLNIVISRRRDYRPEGCLAAAGLPAALALVQDGETEVFIIGGGQLYKEAIALAGRIYLTVIPLDVAGDTFFPVIPEQEFAVTAHERVEGPQPYDFFIYDRTRG